MYRLALHRIAQTSHIAKKLPLVMTCRLISKESTPKTFFSNYEPEYLNDLPPEIPLYDLVNVQIKGYDFPLLENYQKFVHRIAASLEIDTDDSWAIAPQNWDITKIEPNSSVVDATYHLSLYERNVQISDVPSTVLPIFIEVIQTGLPEGVNMEVLVHTEDQEEAKYIPDLELKELETKLDELGGPRDVRVFKRK